MTITISSIEEYYREMYYYITNNFERVSNGFQTEEELVESLSHTYFVAENNIYHIHPEKKRYIRDCIGFLRDNILFYCPRLLSGDMNKVFIYRSTLGPPVMGADLCE